MWIADGHQDIAWSLLETGRDFAIDDPKHSLSLPALRSAGAGLVFATIYASGDWPVETAVESARRQFRFYEDLAGRFPDDLCLVKSRADLENGKAAGLTGLMILMEGADPVASVGDLERYRRSGMRILSLTWNTPNKYAGGTSRDEGLTSEGRDLLKAMKDAGIALDVSHLGDRSIETVLELWDGPILASHSNARAVTGVPRNLEDRHIREIAARGGVIGLNFCAAFLSRRTLDRESPGPVPFADLAAHATHLASVGGPGCVALGTDYDGGFGPEWTVEGFTRVSELPLLPAALVRAGLDAKTAVRLMGGNWLALAERILG